MSIFGIHLAILTDEQHAIVKQALADAGHDLETFAGSEIDKLVAAAKEKFPDLVADIQKGIADLKDSTLSPSEKLFKVAEDALETAPDVIKALPNAKDFLIQAAQSVFTDGLAELKTEAGKVLAAL
jgi:predicted RNA-binding protein with EMAP domain